VLLSYLVSYCVSSHGAVAYRLHIRRAGTPRTGAGPLNCS